MIANLGANTDFLKAQLEQSITEVKNLKQQLPSKQEVNNLSAHLAQNRPRRVEIETRELLQQNSRKIEKIDSQLNEIKKLITGER